ncbi:hypothetical protein Vretifemale_6079 [Volvox reticuliferus]|uniref:AB hydrolase-1 domain-containing protein n=1 Tax=Volvox reticuliferus TaxID=1737510 RepID=A0A8J4FM87_9CHLO|nr:hypothetical protein Vretifemale_6079 [Volvox reticuliferus]
MLHGILGNRKNMASFAKMLVVGFPSWQVLLVDLRCHGESASLPTRPDGPHGVAQAGSDVLALLQRLRLFPRVLIGHSFGGKVVMSMVQQFPKRLPRTCRYGCWTRCRVRCALAAAPSAAINFFALDPHASG